MRPWNRLEIPVDESQAGEILRSCSELSLEGDPSTSS